MVRICGRELTKFQVVVPENPHPAEVKAAELLEKYAVAAYGKPLEGGGGSIYIGGERDTSGIRDDGFRVAVNDGELYLYGAIPRGTLYAVCGFAEKYLGYRMFAPGAELVKPLGDIELPEGFSETDNPGFSLRNNDWHTHTTDPEFNAWERVNAAGADLSEYGGRMKILGGCHTFEGLCPPRKYFAEHPEYYSYYEGRRVPAGNQFDSDDNAQLCLTNPDVLKIVTENVLERLRANPDAKIVDVSQNDNMRYCRCESCAASDAEEGSPSGTLLRFVNAVAQAVEKEFPGVSVQTFAYQYTRKPPRLTRPRKNVIVRYCTIEACFRHGLDDSSCERNEAFAPELAEWGRICSNISVWDYVTNYSCYLAPFPNYGVLRGNVRFFAENNVVHLFEEDTPGTAAGDLAPMRAYLLAKLMWNPRMSEEEFETHRNEFLEGYFGAGYKNLLEYMRIVEEETKDFHMRCFESMDNAFLGSDPKSELYIPLPYQPKYEKSYLRRLLPRMDELKELWDAAAREADAEQKRRLDISRMSLDYLDLFCSGRSEEDMSEKERAAYERECALWYGRKQRYGIHTNIWTARAGH